MLVVSCASTERDESEPVFDRVVRVEPTATSIALDIEDPGKIIVTHGFGGCGESDQDGEEAVVELEGSFTVPTYADAATVFLSGWQLSYLGGDEHLNSLAAGIFDIELSGSELSWLARGFIQDEDGNDGYEFCYHYTVLAWNRGLVHAFVDHDNENFNYRAALFKNETTALSALSSYLQNVEFSDAKAVASLPRGSRLAGPQNFPSSPLTAGLGARLIDICCRLPTTWITRKHSIGKVRITKNFRYLRDRRMQAASIRHFAVGSLTQF